MMLIAKMMVTQLTEKYANESKLLYLGLFCLQGVSKKKKNKVFIVFRHIPRGIKNQADKAKLHSYWLTNALYLS